MIVSTTAMIRRLEGLLDTGRLTVGEQEFVRELSVIAQSGEVTKLTGDQVDTLDELHGRHFA